MVRRARVTVRLDPIAELRRMTGGVDPDPVDAAVLADMAGVDGIAVRYHPDGENIQRRDLDLLSGLVKSYFTVEVTRNPRAVEEAIELKPDRILLISDSASEMTGDREFGLDVAAQPTRYAPILTRCREAGISPWVLIEPLEEQVSAARDVGAEGIVLDTTRLTWVAQDDPQEMRETQREERLRLETASRSAVDLGLFASIAGGLGRRILADVVTIPEIEEVIVGYAVAARAVFVGFEAALQEILDELPRVGEEV